VNRKSTFIGRELREGSPPQETTEWAVQCPRCLSTTTQRAAEHTQIESKYIF